MLDSALTWPADAAAEAVAALARRLGFASGLSRAWSRAGVSTINQAAVALGLEIEAVETTVREAAATLIACAPALLAMADGRWIAVAGHRGHCLRVLCPDGRLRSASTAEILRSWQEPWEKEAGPEIDHLLDASGLGERRHQVRPEPASDARRAGPASIAPSSASPAIT